jgi:hypothetical protein
MTTMRIRALAVAAVGMLLLFTSTAAFAAPPVVSTREVSGTGTFSCGSFEVQEEYTYRVRTTRFYDNQGSLVRGISHLSWKGYLTNTTTGQTLMDHTERINHVDFTTYNYSSTGLLWGITVPGRGIVVQDIGRLVFDENGNIIFQAGTFQVLYGGYDVVCAAFD